MAERRVIFQPMGIRTSVQDGELLRCGAYRVEGIAANDILI